MQLEHSSSQENPIQELKDTATGSVASMKLAIAARNPAVLHPELCGRNINNYSHFLQEVDLLFGATYDAARTEKGKQALDQVRQIETGNLTGGVTRADLFAKLAEPLLDTETGSPQHSGSQSSIMFKPMQTLIQVAAANPCAGFTQFYIIYSLYGKVIQEHLHKLFQRAGINPEGSEYFVSNDGEGTDYCLNLLAEGLAAEIAHLDARFNPVSIRRVTRVVETFFTELFSAPIATALPAIQSRGHAASSREAYVQW